MTRRLIPRDTPEGAPLSRSSQRRSAGRVIRQHVLIPPTPIASIYAAFAVKFFSRITARLFNFARRDPHDLDGVADHVGGALLAFRTGRQLQIPSEGNLARQSNA